MALTCKAFGDIITFTRASSATFTGSNGLIQSATTNTPRFDYDPVTLAAKGLLIEEQRTNLRTYSEDFSNAAWTKSDASITSNSVVAPDGATTADTLIENTATSFHFVNQLLGTIGVVETSSVYAKPAGRTWLFIGLGSGATAYFDIQNGALGTVTGSGATATIVNAGNGWFRCSLTHTRSGNSNNLIASASGNGSASYTGDGTSGIYIWGAQLEAGSFATSYIPTVASQVTRSADTAAVNTLSPWYNATEGTLYAECSTVKPTSNLAAVTIIDINDGSIANRNLLYYNNANIQARTFVSSVEQSSILQAYTANQTDKLAYAIKASDFAFARNGSIVGTTPSGTVPVVNRMNIGGISGSANLNGWIRRITYYPRRLSNAELQAITA